MTLLFIFRGGASSHWSITKIIIIVVVVVAVFPMRKHFVPPKSSSMPPRRRPFRYHRKRVRKFIFPFLAYRESFRSPRMRRYRCQFSLYWSLHTNRRMKIIIITLVMCSPPMFSIWLHLLWIARGHLFRSHCRSAFGKKVSTEIVISPLALISYTLTQHTFAPRNLLTTNAFSACNFKRPNTPTTVNAAICPFHSICEQHLVSVLVWLSGGNHQSRWSAVEYYLYICYERKYLREKFGKKTNDKQMIE